MVAKFQKLKSKFDKNKECLLDLDRLKHKSRMIFEDPVLRVRRGCNFGNVIFLFSV